jgi:hypothetical protein
MATKSTAVAQADSRAAMIAEAAYFAAERRNFEPGYELTDWLAAEQEVAAQTVGKKTTRKKASKAKPKLRK